MSSLVNDVPDQYCNDQLRKRTAFVVCLGRLACDAQTSAALSINDLEMAGLLAKSSIVAQWLLRALYLRRTVTKSSPLAP
jgi:hypothetical protein